MDRSILIRLERIKETGRKTDSSLESAFELDKSKLLGGLFDAVSGMLEREPSLVLHRLPRLADYYRHAVAASMHLGYGAEKFEQAYDENISHQKKEAVFSSPSVQTILVFLKGKSSWEGSATALYGNLEHIAKHIKVENDFPRSPNWLWRKIQEAQNTLLSIGIQAESDRTSLCRVIRLQKTEAYNKAIDATLPDIITFPFRDDEEPQGLKVDKSTGKLVKDLTALEAAQRTQRAIVLWRKP